MSILSSLTRPRIPRNAFIFDGSEVAAVELRRRGSRFALAAAAKAVLPEGLLTPSFDGRNISDSAQLAEVMNGVVESAGLGKRQRWSVLLPDAVVKTMVIGLDSVPSTRDELREILNWKVKQMVGVPASELRISRQFVGAGKSPRFLAVAARRSVIEQYDAVLGMLGWRAGIAVPRYVGEAAWFDWDHSPGDKLLIGWRGTTCVAALVRAGELVFVRSIDGAPERFDDEIYRLTLYYRDRVAESPERAAVAKVLVYGPIDGERVLATVGDALGTRPTLVRPVPDLLDAGIGEELHPALLAAAGLATQAWSHG